MKLHMYKNDKQESPDTILIGPKDPEKWRIGVQIRGEAKRLTNEDRIEIGKFINSVLIRRLEPKSLIITGSRY